MKLLIARHGKTLELENSIIQQFHTPLSETWVKEAQTLAESLKDEQIDIVFVSPCTRTQQTLAEVMKYHLDTPVIIEKRIQERSFGKREWINANDLLALYGKEPNNSNLSDIYEIDPDIEHSDSLMIRGKDFLDEIKSKYANKTVLIVCHRQMNTALIRTIENKPYGRFMDLKNGVALKFEI